MLGEDSGVEVDGARRRAGRALGALGRRPRPGRGACSSALGAEEDRRARYVCHLSRSGPGGEEHVGVGTLEGRIAAAPAGDEGFGYDPIFVPEQEERTVAELGDDVEAAALAPRPRGAGARRAASL